MEIGSLYQIALGPKGPEMGVRILQTPCFNEMEIQPWYAVGSIGFQAVEYISNSQTSLAWKHSPCNK